MVLVSLRISPLFLIGIATNALLFAAVIAIYAVYIHSIGSGLDIFSELFPVLLSSMVPVKPRKLTKLQQAAFSLPFSSTL